MPLAGQSHVLLDHIFVLEGITVEETVEAVVEIAFFALLLEEGSVDCLGFAVDHLNDLGWSSVTLGVVKGDNLFLSLSLLPRKLAHLKLQRLDHRISDQVATVLLRGDNGGRVEIGGKCMFEDMCVGLVRGVGGVANRTVHELLGCDVRLVTAEHHATVPIHSRHHNNFIYTQTLTSTHDRIFPLLPYLLKSILTNLPFNVSMGWLWLLIILK